MTNAQLELLDIDIRSADEHYKAAQVHFTNQRRAEELGCQAMARIFGELATRELRLAMNNE